MQFNPNNCLNIPLLGVKIVAREKSSARLNFRFKSKPISQVLFLGFVFSPRDALLVESWCLNWYKNLYLLHAAQSAVCFCSASVQLLGAAEFYSFDHNQSDEKSARLSSGTFSMGRESLRNAPWTQSSDAYNNSLKNVNSQPPKADGGSGARGWNRSSWRWMWTWCWILSGPRVCQNSERHQNVTLRLQQAVFCRIFHSSCQEFVQ